MQYMKENLKDVFTTSGKLYDVFLSHDELVWTAKQNSLNAATTTQTCTVSTRSVKLSQVTGVSLKEQLKINKDGNNLHGFNVYFYQQGKQRRLKQTSVAFESTNKDICQLWVETINSLLKEFPDRPQKLKIVINPHGGQGKAPKIYLKKVAPLFNLAGIEVDVLVTERAGHAWEYLSTADMSTFDGVVCVGGDGIVHEVVNGLLEKVYLDSGIDVANGEMPKNFEALKLPMRVGIIPAGSTDVIVYSAQGVDDPVTSALHIIVGNSQPLDVCSLVDSDGKLVRFTFSLAYGFLGDVLKSSEQSRWMGPRRYKWAATKRLTKLRTYEVEISYLPSQTRDRFHPRDNSRCRKGCEVCANVVSRVNSTAADIQTDSHSPGEMQEFRGRVVGASLITLPSPCKMSPDGPSPSCHLGDGFTDLIIVKQCSKPEMFSHIQRNFNSKDQFDFDFVETHRVKECRIRARLPNESAGKEETGDDKENPSASRRRTRRWIGMWNADGELLQKTEILVRVHRQLVSVFGDGIKVEETETRRVGCVPKLK